MDNLTTGKFIAERRKALGLSQKQLAESLDVTDKAVSKWETGRGAPDIALLIPLAQILGVSVAELLSGEKAPAENITSQSDEVIISTMKSKRKGLLKLLSVMLLLFALVLCLKPAYHFFSSVPVENDALYREAVRYTQKQFSGSELSAEDFAFVDRSLEKGKYLALLGQKDDAVVMVVFEQDSIFGERYAVMGAGYGKRGELNLYSTSGGGMNLNVFYGCDLTDTEEYRFTYGNTRYSTPITDGTVLDIFLDINRTFYTPCEMVTVKSGEQK
ncbi:MAG: helix-turn-helix transcriptional regulator [Oscillospiraceae bacterium]|nr:helix-turn-helix transcriptional regulator [Oscillospiraceae bacterium]